MMKTYICISAPNPQSALKHLADVWSYTSWITEEYAKLITDLAEEIKIKNDRPVSNLGG